MSIVERSIVKMLNRENGAKAFESCMQEFTSFHVLNYIMHEEAVKMFDMIEDAQLDRFKVKKLKRQCNDIWDKYAKTLVNGMKQDAYYLLQDYCNVAYGKAEPRLVHLYVAMANYLANQPREQKNRNIIAQGMVVQIMSTIIHDTWNLYFKAYKGYCGLDFESDFRYADLSPFMIKIQMIGDELSKGYDSIDFGKDKACVNAFRALKNEINREDFFNDSAKTAIYFSPTLTEKYEDELKKIKEEENKKEMAVIADRLSEKFNVKRVKSKK